MVVSPPAWWGRKLAHRTECNSTRHDPDAMRPAPGRVVRSRRAAFPCAVCTEPWQGRTRRQWRKPQSGRWAVKQWTRWSRTTARSSRSFKTASGDARWRRTSCRRPLRGLDKLPEFESEESAVAWFYRVLRNAVIDHHRRSGASERALSVLTRELETNDEPDLDMRNAACRCVGLLAETLKPEYAAALRRVEVEGVPVQEFAREAGITANNAGVRLF